MQYPGWIGYRALVALEVFITFIGIQAAMWTDGAALLDWAIVTLSWALITTIWRKNHFTTLGFWPHKQHAEHQHWKDWRDNLRSSLFLAPFALALGGLVMLSGWYMGSINTSDDFGFHIFRYYIWALLQQFGMQSYFFLRLEYLLKNSSWAVLATAITFALCHVPNPVLVIVTGLGGLVLSYHFSKFRNIYAVAFMHVVLGLTIAIALPEDFHSNMRVGSGYRQYQIERAQRKSVIAQAE